MILWFWIALLLRLTTADLVIWMLRVIIRADRLHFIWNQLGEASQVSCEEIDERMTSSFLDHYLRQDGGFVLRLIAQNTSAMTSADITGRLYLIWKSRHLNDVIEEVGEI